MAYANRWLFGAVLALTLFCLGAWRTDCRNREVRVQWSEERQAYRGWVSGRTEEKARSRLVPVEVGGRQVLLYLPKDSASSRLACGDEILFHAHVRPPRNRGADIGFDYAAYLFRQGVSGTAYAPAGSWRQGPGHRPPGLKRRALQWRDELVGCYRAWGFAGDELSVIAALTLGDKSELDADLRASYSVAGASHVLALSGLHLGIVVAILSTLLLWRPTSRRVLWVRGLLLLAALWAFAFLTGLSGSVVRSAVMFTVLIVGRCLGRRGLLLNSLALAAFAMLLYDPFYLYDVGFQLSFMAVAGIALFMPVFRRRAYKGRLRVVRHAHDLLWVSVAAQLGVAPLIACYFDNFPVYFLLTNLLVIPLSWCILVASVGLWLSTLFPVLHGWMVALLQVLLRLLNDSVVWVAGLPGASFGVSFSALDVVCCYWLLAGLLVFYHLRSARVVQVGLGGVGLCLAGKLAGLG